MKLVSSENKYTFEVTRNATKGQIKDAVEAVFDVKVEGVNVLKNRGRQKRSFVNRRKVYTSADTKKAIVQLAEKDNIKIFEGGK